MIRFGDRRLPERFWSKVQARKASDLVRSHCWIWTANSTPKYGRFWLGKAGVLAHRHAYEVLVGPVPKGLQLDHLCRVKLCVRPTHLEPVTNAENLTRALVALRGEVCPKCGTPYEGRSRRCKPCVRAYKTEWARQERERHPERQRERNRRYYEKMMSTPEGRERLAAKQRNRHN